MEAVAQHLQNVAVDNVQQAQADYARIIKAPRQFKKDLDRMIQVTQLLGNADQVAADSEAWTAYKIATAKAKTEDVHRLALKNLAPQLRSAKSRSNGIMSRRHREENIHAVGRMVTKHSGLLRQAEDAAKRIIELREQHPFFGW